MKQGKNLLKIDGVLLKKEFEKGVNSLGNFIKGSFTIRANDGSTLDFKTYQSELTKDGKENSAYKGMITIANEYKTVAEVGEENADIVSVNRGNITKNIYKNKNTSLVVENVYFSTRNMTRIGKDSKMLDKPVLTLSGVVHKKSKKYDKESGDLTSIELEFVVPNYKGEFESYKVSVVMKDAIDYFDEQVRVNDSLELDMDVNYKSIEKTVVIHRSFGGDKVETTFERHRALEVTGVNELVDKSAWSDEDIETGIRELEKKLENIANSDVKQNTGNSKSFTGAVDTRKDIKDTDIPF